MANQNGNAASCISYGQMNLINTLRKIMLELPMWRRAYLVSFASNSGDLNIIGNRLYRMPTDIGNVLEAFFGSTIARTIENMFREQIIIGAEILRAEKAGDTQAVNEGTQRLYQNINNMSGYLAQVNPYWDKDTWNNLLHDYYENTIMEMVLVLAGKYEESVRLYESMENQALNIADYMARGIIPYFEGKGLTQS